MTLQKKQVFLAATMMTVLSLAAAHKDDERPYAPTPSACLQVIATGTGMVTGYYGYKVARLIWKEEPGTTKLRKDRFTHIALRFTFPLINSPLFFAMGVGSLFVGGFVTGVGIAAIKERRSEEDICYLCRNSIDELDPKKLSCGHKLHEGCFREYHVTYATAHPEDPNSKVCLMCRKPVNS